jgi:hypothetical protein
MKQENCNCKEQLLFFLLQAFKHLPYMSVSTLHNAVYQNKFNIKLETVNRYLITFKQNGVIFDAGRGWYSSIAEPFILDSSSVRKIVSVVSKKYPLLDFTCWSTEQISSYGHHLLTKFVTFLYIDRYSMASVYEFLIDKGYDVYSNPSKAGSKDFVIREKTIVLRPFVKTQPNVEHLVMIEGILVELFLESFDLNLIDFDEYEKIFNNLFRQYRINLAKFLGYAKDCKSSSLIKFVESIKTEFSINSSLVDLSKTT